MEPVDFKFVNSYKIIRCHITVLFRDPARSVIIPIPQLFILTVFIIRKDLNLLRF
jgi:hypothetical protein